jgi:hypothetical protein
MVSYFINWLTYIKQLNLNLLKQIKIKMPNLISIIFTSSSFQDFQLIDGLHTNEYKTDMTVNSVITIHCQCESMEDIKQ